MDTMYLCHCTVLYHYLLSTCRRTNPFTSIFPPAKSTRTKTRNKKRRPLRPRLHNTHLRYDAQLVNLVHLVDRPTLSKEYLKYLLPLPNVFVYAATHPRHLSFVFPLSSLVSTRLAHYTIPPAVCPSCLILCQTNINTHMSPRSSVLAPNRKRKGERKRNRKRKRRCY